ncbi:unnamed protein product, partial [Gulo gulo]
GGPPAAGCRGERVVEGGAGRELAGHAHPSPQALQHAPGPHQLALRAAAPTSLRGRGADTLQGAAGTGLVPLGALGSVEFTLATLP